MNRRHFVTASALFIGARCATGQPLATADEVAINIASMPTPDSEYKRSDAFDFRLVRVHDDTAYAVYFLRSDMTDKKDGPRHLEWLESAMLRRKGSAWQVALLHSTRIVKRAA